MSTNPNTRIHHHNNILTSPTEREIIAHRVRELVTELTATIVANSPDLTAEQSAACRASVDAVTETMLKAQPHADALAAIDRQIAATFSIPADVVLPEHQLMAKYAATEDDEQRLTAELESTQAGFNQQAQFIVALDAERRLHRKLDAGIAMELQIMERVERSLRETTTSTEDCKRFVKQLEELRLEKTGFEKDGM